MDYIPASLQSSINFINTFSKNIIKIRPDNGSTASPGDTTEFSIPNNTIVDLSSFAVHKTVTTVTSACTGFPFSECYIQNLRTEMDGQSVENIQNYNQLYQMMANATMSTAQLQTNSCFSLAPKPTTMLVDCADAEGATDAVKEIEANGISTDIGAHTAITSGAGASSAIKLSTDTTFDRATLAPEVVAIFNGIGTEIEGNVNTLKDTLAVVPRIVPKSQSGIGAESSVISNWLGFFGSMNVPVVDTSLMPNIKTYLTWAPNYIHSSAGALTYTLSEIYATVTGYSFPAYAQSLLTAISEGISLRYTYDRYQAHAFTTADGSACEHQFSIASRAIKRVWMTWQLATYATIGALVAGQHTSKCFTHSSGDIADNGITNIQLFLDSKPYPQQVILGADVHGYFHTVRELGVQGLNQFDNLVESNNDWLKRKWFMCFDVSAHNFSDKSMVSGFNTEGGNSNMMLKHGDAGAVGRTLVFAKCVALLSILPGRV